MVARHTIETAGSQERATEQIAAANHDANLDTELAGSHEVIGEPADDIRIDAEATAPRQPLARQFDQNAFPAASHRIPFSQVLNRPPTGQAGLRGKDVPRISTF
jgi:hypothetical protein